MKRSLRYMTLLLLFYTVKGNALTLTVDFTKRSQLDASGGAVWNLALGELHPPLLVTGWDNGVPPPQDTAFDVGDGRHGAFDSGTYALFDVDGLVSGGNIEINTDDYPDLQFTSFQLNHGFTIRPVGSKPLLIRSQSDVIVNGVIDCSGENGRNAIANTNASLAGGAAHCGGGAGGMSVPAATVPSSIHAGQSGSTTVNITGGVGGGSGGSGGGGGGSYAGDLVRTVAGDGGGASGGAHGLNAIDDEFADLAAGGSGGGGGTAYSGAAPAASSGASGGAGGGNVRIYAVRDVSVAVTGQILANGGQGGSVAASGEGGAGGGGAGGSILIFAGRDIINHGAIAATPGSGGATLGGVGGAGAWGRTWLVEKDGYADGSATDTVVNLESPESQLNAPGVVQYEMGVTYTVTSTAIDLQNSRPVFGMTLPVTISNQHDSTVQYQLAVSASSALSSLTNYSTTSSWLGNPGERYVRFQIQFDNICINPLDPLDHPCSVNPIRIQELDINYDGSVQNDFKFATGCGRIKGSPPPSYGLLLLVPLVLALGLRGACIWSVRSRDVPLSK